jgi:hypothetical protein
MTAVELATTAGVYERYLRKWLSHQAASNYLSYDPSTRKFEMPPEQAMVFAIEDSPVYMVGAFDIMAALLDSQEKVQPAFKIGGGVPWGDHTSSFFCAVGRFFPSGLSQQPGESNWLPALDGVVAKLEHGAKVADVGCGHGWSTVMMAKAFPNSQFIGYDFRPGRSSTPLRMPANMVLLRTPDSRWRQLRNIWSRISIWSRSLIVCTTWEIPWERQRMFANP